MLIGCNLIDLIYWTSLNLYHPRTVNLNVIDDKIGMFVDFASMVEALRAALIYNVHKNPDRTYMQVVPASVTG
jgi:hypothetical protein